MTELISLIQDLGAWSLDFFWFPLVIWTVLAAVALTMFRLLSDISAMYQYHSRIAIAWTLPAGIGISILSHWVTDYFTDSVGLATKFIVISNPITVTAAEVDPLMGWTEPTFVLGVVSLLGVAATFFGLIKLLSNILALIKLTRVSDPSLSLSGLLSEKNKHLVNTHGKNISIVISHQVEVPCTFGWNKKRVLVPASLQRQPEKFNIAVRHELMHIYQSDYLLNGSIQIIKALFYFHPLVHLLEKEAGEYRELYCDQHVLTDPDISQKSYAELLFELASKKVFRSTAAVSMAVNPSTLKKRIQVMKTQSNYIPPISRSIALMLITGLLFTSIMACSDMEDGGITNTEVEQAQSKIKSQQLSDTQPIYIVDGEKVNDKKILARIKPKYIESINVLKGEKATAEYGNDGSNGVIEIRLIDKEKAYSDLLDTPPATAAGQNEEENYFVAVEGPPKIKGGLNSIMSQVRYPAECKEANVEGRVVVRFIVNEKGKAEDAEIIRGIGNGCDEEALRVIKNAAFKPGMQRGKPVRVQMSLPIIFQLPNSESAARLNVDPASIEESDLELRNLTLMPDGTLSGEVYSKTDNKPLAGANVQLAASNRGTATNQNGVFIIKNVPEQSSSIKISFVGYRPVKANF